MRRGDTYPPLTLADSNGPIDLTGAKVSYCYRRPRDGRAIRRPLRIIDAQRGLIAPPSQAPPGLVEIEIRYPNGGIQTLGDAVQIVRL